MTTTRRMRNPVDRNLAMQADLAAEILKQLPLEMTVAIMTGVAGIHPQMGEEDIQRLGHRFNDIAWAMGRVRA